jgi:uncharacterized protein YqeY
MSLIQDIRKDMFKASKEGEADVSNILKMVLADVKNEEKALGKELNDEEVQKIMRKQIKKINDSITEFKQMGRDELVQKEQTQLEVLEGYLPALMSVEEIEKVVKRVIEENEIESIRDMGKVMGMVMKELEGKADGNTVRESVQKLLS